MTDVGGNLFQDVLFPIAFGDRFVSVAADRISGQTLVDIYRLDSKSAELRVEFFQGQPAPGAAPITIDPAGGRGGVRLGVAGSSSVVGYLSGGDNPTYIVLGERIEVMRGSERVATLVANSVQGSPIGVRVGDDGSISIGASLPPGFPSRRTFMGMTVRITDLLRSGPPGIVNTDFRDCKIVGPALLAAAGPVVIENSTLPSEGFEWDYPPTSGPLHGVLALDECSFKGCTFENVGIGRPRDSED